jgi:glycogen debranching enzyme
VKYTDQGVIKASESRTRIVIDPILNLDGRLLPLDGINLLTVIPKWLPTCEHWLPFFKRFEDSGYNMVHFAPVNERGMSNSPYSIRNQLSLSNDLFDVQGLSEQEKYTRMASVIARIEENCKILCVTDVVWNHTSCDSEWLWEHPEAGNFSLF